MLNDFVISCSITWLLVLVHSWCVIYTVWDQETISWTLVSWGQARLTFPNNYDLELVYIKSISFILVK